MTRRAFRAEALRRPDAETLAAHYAEVRADPARVRFYVDLLARLEAETGRSLAATPLGVMVRAVTS